MDEKKVKAYLKSKGYEINEFARSVIGEAGDWYRLKETGEHKKFNLNLQPYSLPRMGFAKRAAADDANLCEVIEINPGEGAMQFIEDFMAANQFDTQYRKQLELMSAEGTVACYVYLKDSELYEDGFVRGGDIRLSYVEATGFLPITVENDDITEAAFWGETI